jgi:hypothetical protein
MIFMINEGAQLQTDLKTMMTLFLEMFNEAQDLENLYFKGGVSTDISALLGTNPVTQDTRLTKNELVSGLTFAENLRKLFDNVAVTTADYLDTIQKLTHGNATGTLVSVAVEDFGTRVVALTANALTQYNRARNAVNFYNSSEMAAMIGSISIQKVFYGSEMTKDELTSAITLLQQFQGMLENTAVSTGDYKVTLGKWERLS